MTKEELLKTHPLYDGYLDEWCFFIRSYFGGKMYRDGDYLLQHPFESSVNYSRRKSIAYYYNYCGPIVDIMISHLFRKPPLREYGSFTTDELFKSFLRDCDHDGSSFNQFMRDVQRFASIYGSVCVVVDKPDVLTETMAVAQNHDIRPYLALVTPENMVDWAYIRLADGREVLGMVKIKEGPECYRIWTRECWELWSLDTESDEPVLLDSGIHPLGVVPVVNIYNKRSGVKMLGVSDIQDIADINKNIFYLCSDAKEIIENTAFPMLAVPYEKGGGLEDREIGPRNILQFDPSEVNAKPYWLEAPHSSLTEIRQWVKQDIAEIHRIAKMGGVKATEDFAQPRSGAAIELEYQQLHSVLSEKADNMEQGEKQILKLWGMWQGMEFDGVIDYPDDFSVKELDREIERAIKALGAGITSRTFNREAQKFIAKSALPKIDDEVGREVMREIDEG